MAANSLVSWGEIPDSQFSYGQPRPTGINSRSCLSWELFSNNLFYRGALGGASQMITRAEFDARLYVKPTFYQNSTGQDAALTIDEYSTNDVTRTTLSPGQRIALKVTTVSVTLRILGINEQQPGFVVGSGQVYQVDALNNGLINVYRIA